MGQSKDREALECYRKVLLTLGHVADYVVWKHLPSQWLAKELPNFTARMMNLEMQKYTVAGGKIDQVEEKRPEFVAWRFHYDLRMPLSGRVI